MFTHQETAADVSGAEVRWEVGGRGPARELAIEQQLQLRSRLWVAMGAYPCLACPAVPQAQEQKEEGGAQGEGAGTAHRWRLFRSARVARGEGLAVMRLTCRLLVRA